VPAERTKPVILLAFANDRDKRVEARCLHNLPEETRRLVTVLERAENEDRCELRAVAG
jgi:hypothetical protein